MTRLLIVVFLLVIVFGFCGCVEDTPTVEPTIVAAEPAYANAVPIEATSTTTTRPTPRARTAPSVRSASVGRAAIVGDPPDSDFDRLAQCESNGNPRAVSRTGRYRGAFQFDLDSYRRAGGSGDPINDSYETQMAHARRWQRLVGWDAWPVCSRRLGLR